MVEWGEGWRAGERDPNCSKCILTGQAKKSVCHSESFLMIIRAREKLVD